MTVGHTNEDRSVKGDSASALRCSFGRAKKRSNYRLFNVSLIIGAPKFGDIGKKPSDQQPITSKKRALDVSRPEILFTFLSASRTNSSNAGGT